MESLWQTESKHVFGKRHPDTIDFDDHLELAKFGGAPHKIAELIVAHNGKFVIGLHAVYHIYGYNQTVSGPRHFGKDHSGIREEVIRLNPDEHIVEVFGRGGDIIDNIGFRTSSGRAWDFGGPGGNPFQLRAPYGKAFNTLKGGIGGHLHHIDLTTAPLPQIGGFLPFKAKKDEYMKGKKHPDTVKFSDKKILKQFSGQYKIHTLHVFHDGKFIYGFQTDYFVFGPNQIVKGEKHVGNQINHHVREEKIELGADEFITEIFGRHGDIFDNIGFRTNKGRSWDFGGSGGNPFEIKAPFGRHFAVFRGGLGGHLHNIKPAVEPIFQQPQTFKEQEFRRGKSHPDTRNFSDEAILSKYPPTHKIWKITIFHDKKFVYGWQADYFVFGPNIVVRGERHLGNQWKGGVEEVVELAADEFITEIFGRHGDIMDNFGFATNKGRKFDFGGTGGNPFDVKAPKGYHFGTLRGGLGGHVHNIEMHPVPLQQFGWGW